MRKPGSRIHVDWSVRRQLELAQETSYVSIPKIVKTLVEEHIDEFLSNFPKRNIRAVRLTDKVSR